MQGLAGILRGTSLLSLELSGKGMLDRLFKILKYAKNEKRYIRKFRSILQIY